MILLNIGVGKDWAGPFFPPAPPPPPPPTAPKFYFLSIYLYVYTALSLYLSSHDWNMSRRNPSFLIANFTKCLANWFFKIVGWGKTRPAHSFPLDYFLTFLFISQSLGLTYFCIVSEHSWLSCRKEKFKLRKHLANCMFLLDSGVGKDWAGPFFPPP